MTRAHLLVVIAGPTASGKSDLALRIAREFSGEIVNCDSLQVYRHFDIGTAKVPADQRDGVAHHMIDVADPDEIFSAGEYARRAREVLGEIADRDHLPVVAGGTGFYLRALLDGLPPAPPRDEPLRARLAGREQHRPGSLHRLLWRFDPHAAKRIHPRDVQKVTRALEVCLIARRPLTAFNARRPLDRFAPFKLALNPERARLFQRIDARVERMFERGLEEEVRRILDLGYSADLKPFESLGYKQALDILRGRDRAEAVAEARMNSRRYAKRQWTWFRREPDFIWLDGFGDEPRIQHAAHELILQHVQQIVRET